jgi:hypothetical protein
MKCMTQQQITNHYTIASRAALVAGLSLLMGSGLGCVGMEDSADPFDESIEEQDVQDVDAELAAQESDSALGPCDPNVGFTIKEGNFIKGSGSLPCDGTATVTLQRTILGVWGQDLTSITLNGAGDNRSVIWDCSGSGRYTYRTYITWRTVGGEPGFKESNHLEVDC